MAKVRLLGGPLFFLDGEQQTIQISPQQAEALKLLMVKRNVKIKDMVHNLWPNATKQPETANNLVRVLISQLRKHLEALNSDFRIKTHTRTGFQLDWVENGTA